MLTALCGNKTYKIPHFTATRVGNKLDNIHYIVSARSRPTIVMRHVFNDISIKINNETFCKETGQSIIFSDDNKNPQYTGVIISNVFPYLDTNDEINLGTDAHKIFYSENALERFEWEIDGSSSSSVTLIGTSTNSTYASSTLNLQVRL